MSSQTKKKVLRNQTTKNVENYDLPQWDRFGNIVERPESKQVPIQVEDVPEESVKVPTLKEVESIREEAYNEGFEQGYENGMAQGQREGQDTGHKEGFAKGQQEGQLAGETSGRNQALAEEQKKTEEKLAVLSAVSSEIQNQIPVEQAELEQAILALAVKVSRQVLQDELRLKPNHIAPIVHAAVQSLPNPDEKLTLFLNPEEKDFVATFADSHWTLESDDSVSMGGCKIKSGFSYVDFTLEHRFDQAVNHLVSHITSEDAIKYKQTFSKDFLMRTEDASQLLSESEEAVDEAANLDVEFVEHESELTPSELSEGEASDNLEDELTEFAPEEVVDQSVDSVEEPNSKSSSESEELTSPEIDLAVPDSEEEESVDAIDVALEDVENEPNGSPQASEPVASNEKSSEINHEDESSDIIEPTEEGGDELDTPE